MQFLKLVSAMALAGALAGCVSSTDDPYPVTGDRVNPTPARGYKVRCETVPKIPNLFGDTHVTGCEQLIGPTRSAIVAKG
jgi:hypothetical protein